ncbi:MAG: aspartate 1-decarboxylase [Minisyncoccia bacterium]
MSLSSPLPTGAKVIVCFAKLHGVHVTDANLDYMGSITIDKALLEASGLLKGQIVQITNFENGMLWRTYIIEGERGKGEITLNGPPAHFFKRGDRIVVLGEMWVLYDQAKQMSPTVVFVDDENKITEVKPGLRPE